MKRNTAFKFTMTVICSMVLAACGGGSSTDTSAADTAAAAAAAKAAAEKAAAEKAAAEKAAAEAAEKAAAEAAAKAAEKAKADAEAAAKTAAEKSAIAKSYVGGNVTGFAVANSTGTAAFNGAKFVAKNKSNLDIGDGSNATTATSNASLSATGMTEVLNKRLDTIVVATSGNTTVYLEDFDFRTGDDTTSISDSATGTATLTHIYVGNATDANRGATVSNITYNPSVTRTYYNVSGEVGNTKTSTQGTDKSTVNIYQSGRVNYTPDYVGNLYTKNTTWTSTKVAVADEAAAKAAAAAYNLQQAVNALAVKTANKIADELLNSATAPTTFNSANLQLNSTTNAVEFKEGQKQALLDKYTSKDTDLQSVDISAIKGTTGATANLTLNNDGVIDAVANGVLTEAQAQALTAAVTDVVGSMLDKTVITGTQNTSAYLTAVTNAYNYEVGGSSGTTVAATSVTGVYTNKLTTAQTTSTTLSAASSNTNVSSSRSGNNTVGEVYGARTFATKAPGNSTSAALKAAQDDESNLPLVQTKDGKTGGQLRYVQYGRVTSNLNNQLLSNFKDGVAIAGQTTKVAAYGVKGEAGTEDNYFYRAAGDNAVNATKLAAIKEKYTKLAYDGHAVTYGINNNFFSENTTVGAKSVPNAIGNDDTGRVTGLISGTHVHADVDLTANTVTGSLFNKWYDSAATNKTRNVELVAFNGTLNSNGNIYGTATAATGAVTTGSEAATFAANLYGSVTDVTAGIHTTGTSTTGSLNSGTEMGGSIVSVKNEEANRWGAVFGAIQTGATGIVKDDPKKTVDGGLTSATETNSTGTTK